MADPLSRPLRKAETGDFSWVQVRAASRSMLCSSVRTAIRVVSFSVRLGAERVGQAEDPLGDDVGLDFLASAVDRRGLAGKPGAHAAQFIGRKTFAVPAETL